MPPSVLLIHSLVSFSSNFYSDLVVVYNNLQGSSRKINFCQWCGGPTKQEIPDGEEKTRAVCTRCGRITYENPKMVSVEQ